MSNTKESGYLATHDALFFHPRCPHSRASIVQDIQAELYSQARDRLKRAYKECFNIEPTDWQFLSGLASVRTQMVANTVLETTNGTDRTYIMTNLLKGHGPIRDLYDADIDRLLEAGLLRRPRVAGEPRKRIIYKPYFVLTSEATDCLDVGTVGPNVGDFGETVAHAVGARLYGEYMIYRVQTETDLNATVMYYDDLILDDHDIDVAVHVFPDGKSHNKRLYAVGEVKTVLSSDQEVLNTHYKMGTVECEHKHWVAPRREMINEILNVATRRGWYSVQNVPETLSIATAPESGIRSTNDRVAESEYVATGLGTPRGPPFTAGFTYTMLYRALKANDPSLFDRPVVREAASQTKE